MTVNRRNHQCGGVLWEKRKGSENEAVPDKKGFRYEIAE